VHDCAGDAEITVRLKLKVKAQFNTNYRSGIEVLEDEAVEEMIALLPRSFGVEVLDVSITNYEHKTAEREVEDES
jgi:hypothetical protein